jgi:hypothetical protein
MKTSKTAMAVALAALFSAGATLPAAAADPNAPTTNSTTTPNKPGVTSNTGITNGAVPSAVDSRERGTNTTNGTPDTRQANDANNRASRNAAGAADTVTTTGGTTTGTRGTASTPNNNNNPSAGAASNTNSLTGPQSNTVDRGTSPSGYHWWQKEWWQQHAQNNRVTRKEYMDQMGRRWDEMDTQRRGYMTPDELARAFGDETTVAPGGATSRSTAGGAGMPESGASTTRSGTGNSTSGPARQ